MTVLRLLKALRHEAPNVEATARRLGAKGKGGEALAYVLKTLHTGHAGKTSVVRVLAGSTIWARNNTSTVPPTA